MPFKSKAQHRLFRYLESKGKLPAGTSSRWAKHTADMSALPDHKKEKRAVAEKFEPGAAPNYRLALGEVNQCTNCLQFVPGAATCRRFEIPVAPNYVCDAWEPNKRAIKKVTIDTDAIPSQPKISLGMTPVGGGGGGQLKFAETANPVQRIAGISSPVVPPPQGPQQQQQGMTPVDVVNSEQPQQQQAQPQQPMPQQQVPQPQPQAEPQPQPQPQAAPQEEQQDPAAPIPPEGITQFLNQLRDHDKQVIQSSVAGLVNNQAQPKQAAFRLREKILDKNKNEDMEKNSFLMLTLPVLYALHSRRKRRRLEQEALERDKDSQAKENPEKET